MHTFDTTDLKNVKLFHVGVANAFSATGSETIGKSVPDKIYLVVNVLPLRTTE